MSRRKPGAGDYEVGYGKPPLATRFRPGRSGNPSGRRKPEKTIADDLREAINAKIKVVENGHTRTLRVIQVIFRNLVAEAMRKNLRAISVLLSLEARYGASAESVLDPEDLPPDDAAILREFIEKARDASNHESDLLPRDGEAASRDGGEAKPEATREPEGSPDD